MTDVAGNSTTVTFGINTVLPVITLSDYNKTLTNQDIVVNATVDKGVLNQNSHTFTENGSFTFIATDEYGNVVKKQ